MKRGLIICMLILSGFWTDVKAGDGSQPAITYGIEWGYSATFASGYHYNFFDPDGFVVDTKRLRATYISNGEVSLHAGYNLNKFWNLSLYCGYTGVGNFSPAIPISLRATRYFGAAHMDDRWFAFMDIGSGISVKRKPQEIYTGKLGGGYRISLSRVTKLDFSASLRLIYTHPEINYYKLSLPDELINRHDGFTSSLNISIGLTF